MFFCLFPLLLLFSPDPTGGFNKKPHFVHSLNSASLFCFCFFLFCLFVFFFFFFFFVLFFFFFIFFFLFFFFHFFIFYFFCQTNMIFFNLTKTKKKPLTRYFILFRTVFDLQTKSGVWKKVNNKNKKNTFFPSFSFVVVGAVCVWLCGQLGFKQK